MTEKTILQRIFSKCLKQHLDDIDHRSENMANHSNQEGGQV